MIRFEPDAPRPSHAIVTLNPGIALIAKNDEHGTTKQAELDHAKQGLSGRADADHR